VRRRLYQSARPAPHRPRPAAGAGVGPRVSRLTRRWCV